MATSGHCLDFSMGLSLRHLPFCFSLLFQPKKKFPHVNFQEYFTYTLSPNIHLSWHLKLWLYQSILYFKPSTPNLGNLKVLLEKNTDYMKGKRKEGKEKDMKNNWSSILDFQFVPGLSQWYRQSWVSLWSYLLLHPTLMPWLNRSFTIFI